MSRPPCCEIRSVPSKDKMSGKSGLSAWASAPPSWITSPGNDLEGTVISSRARIARNFLGSPFPHHATASAQKKNLELIAGVLSSSDVLGTNHAFRLGQLSPIEKSFLMERQLISHEHSQKEGEKGLVVSAGEGISVMINEEDHIRAAAFKPGLALSDAWITMSQLDDELAAAVPVSYSAEFGYITACPTNIGTGLRASALLHLPALVMTGKIQVVIDELAREGLTIRGFYGEGTTALGDLFQISNGRTLGATEAQIVKHVEHAVKEIGAFERKEESNLMARENATRTQDLIFRAFGTLQWARALNYADGMKNLSLIRLGLKLKLELPLSFEKVSSLFFLSQPAHLMIRAGKEKTPDAVLRAEFFRSAIEGN